MFERTAVYIAADHIQPVLLEVGAGDDDTGAIVDEDARIDGVERVDVVEDFRQARDRLW
ncbi:hypothetical protein D3C76_1863060 [compost metagenome]